MTSTLSTLFSPLLAPFTWPEFLARRASAQSDETVRGLSRDTSFSLRRASGRRITCAAGRLWLTYDADPRDILLEAGQSHVCDSDARLVVYGLRRSTVVIG